MSPFGGIKDSGLGYKEGVVEAMKSFTNVKTYFAAMAGLTTSGRLIRRFVIESSYDRDSHGMKAFTQGESDEA
jgi:NAD-dependent aldehyde dehydrogenases